MSELDLNRLIGGNLRRLRKARGWSLADFAEMVGVSPQRVSGIENSREPMGKVMMENICNTLHIRPWEFYVEADTPILATDDERQKLKLYRIEQQLGIADQVRETEEVWIETARKKAGGGADLQSRIDRIKPLSSKRKPKRSA